MAIGPKVHIYCYKILKLKKNSKFPIRVETAFNKLYLISWSQNSTNVIFIAKVQIKNK